MKKILVCVSCLLSIMAPIAGNTAVEYTQRVLGTMGGMAAEAKSININGQIVGSAYFLPNGNRAFSYNTTAGVTSLSQLDANGISSVATGVNSQGLATGYASSTSCNGRFHSCVWDTSGNITDIDATNGSWGYGINDSGSVVGYSEQTGQGHASQRACVWDSNGAMTYLDTPADYEGRPVTTSRASAINASGSIGGLVQWGAGGHASVWDSTGAFRLVDTVSNSTSAVTCINDSGLMAGYIWSEGAGYSEVPCVWNSDGSILYKGNQTGKVLGMNNRGQVVGSLFDWTHNNTTAFVWDIANGLTILDTQLGSQANSINDNGWIAGRTLVNGDYSVALWTPVPEPSSILALISGIIGLSGIALRKRK